MKKIEEQIEHIEEELEGAKCYAEKYLMCKAKGKSRATQYKTMAQEELSHSNILHSFVVEDIQELEKVYTPPVKMQEEWDKEHKEYIERTAWIKQMLSM